MSNKINVKPGLNMIPTHYLFYVTVPSITASLSSPGTITENGSWIDLDVEIPKEISIAAAFGETPGFSVNASSSDSNQMNLKAWVYWDFKKTDGSVISARNELSANIDSSVFPTNRNALGYRTSDLWTGNFNSFNYSFDTPNPPAATVDYDDVYQIRLAAEITVGSLFAFATDASGEVVTNAGTFLVGLFQNDGGDYWQVPYSP